MIVSKKLVIKPGCIRSVHVRVDSKCKWVVKFNEKYIAVTGRTDGTFFIPDEKYRYIIENYTPKRTNRKKNNVEVKINRVKIGSGNCFYEGQPRRISYNNRSKTRGRISWNGKFITVNVSADGIAE